MLYTFLSLCLLDKILEHIHGTHHHLQVQLYQQHNLYKCTDNENSRLMQISLYQCHKWYIQMHLLVLSDQEDNRCKRGLMCYRQTCFLDSYHIFYGL